MTVRTRSRRTADQLCAEAVELAREAAVEAARPQPLGPHLGVVTEGDRLVTHLFDCLDPAYRGWRWSVTVTRASRARHVTVDEVALLPGPDALLAPQWVPWSERLRPGDLSPGDLLPAPGDDLRLEPGFSGEDEPPPNSVESPGATVEEEPGAAAAEPEAAEEPDAGAAPPPRRATIAAIAEELGLGRVRVLSRHGMREAADRWEEQYGADTPMAQAAPGTCASCGFLVPMTGSLRQAFGVCANQFSPADGRVVSLAYGCGGHSEAARTPAPKPPPPPVIDHLGADPL
ncbi:DUF3027 domain-containing protein [Streptomyces aidingensis]|uniref:DUF3027 domain-containing protein n=1 Tax=Streptomyces aidingensis TaxID=910347 RepID=A0A1I1HNB7_9ACTN|nr:DUF3027 domain-containing protein [Streptomyces aidingensis]SFC22510.1 Protein of unknown function [Streptomyces aidingensis]